MERKKLLEQAEAKAKECTQALGKENAMKYKRKMVYLLQYKKYEEVRFLISEVIINSNKEVGVMTNIFTDPENNKDMMYTFINAFGW